MALGTLSRTHRPFQAVYVPLWYSVANGLPLFDFMGALRDRGEPAAGQPTMTVAVAAALRCVVLATTGARRLGGD
ncbi:hypothetical protein ACIQU6_36325 [Streptomyces sp. NPDC090442]|uniref:hypothetical protein n=1 Tax=Streptomyces sp. NPDC090442 TaxID=3365962 RepID=UPI00380034DE